MIVAFLSFLSMVMRSASPFMGLAGRERPNCGGTLRGVVTLPSGTTHLLLFLAHKRNFQPDEHN